MNSWNARKPDNHRITYSFMSVMAPPWMDPAIFGPGVFEKDFERICSAMPAHTPYDQVLIDHMAGIGRQIANTTRNVPMIYGLIDYLTEMDRRRGTNWKLLFPWLDQDWK
jgi:hypothetical protein